MSKRTKPIVLKQDRAIASSVDVATPASKQGAGTARLSLFRRDKMKRGRVRVNPKMDLTNCSQGTLEFSSAEYVQSI